MVFLRRSESSNLTLIYTTSEKSVHDDLRVVLREKWANSGYILKMEKKQSLLCF